MEDSGKKKDEKEEKALVPEIVEGRALVEREPELTPAEMKAQLVDMNEKRKIFQLFVKDQIKEKVHSYTIQGSDKPALSKSGGLLLCGLYRVVPEYTYKEIRGPKGAYEVSVKCRLFSEKTSKKVAEGDGSCSTQEVKYKYRWVYERDIPKALDKSLLKTKKAQNKKTKEWFTLYRTENEELEDQHNTVLKLGCKRSMVAASLGLPFASEAFTQDLEENIAPTPVEKKGGKKGEAPAEAAPAQGEEQPPAAADESVSGAQQRMIHAKFKWLGIDDKDKTRLLTEWYPHSEGHVWDDKTNKGLSKKDAHELIDAFTKDPDLIKNAIKSFKEEKK